MSDIAIVVLPSICKVERVRENGREFEISPGFVRRAFRCAACGKVVYEPKCDCPFRSYTRSNRQVSLTPMKPSSKS